MVTVLDIRRYAEDKGCILGICDAAPLEDERARLLAAFSATPSVTPSATPFVTKDVEKRIDPGLTLDGAKSVIVFGKPYEPSPYSNLSSLAFGRDYHEVLTEIMQGCVDAFLGDSRNVIMVDSGPLAERAFAVKAGLGFWGKNAMVISPELGSFFNIGLIVTDAILEPAENLQEHPQEHLQPLKCPDDCNRCIDACPTGAIKPYVVDSSNCVSYLTQKSQKTQKKTQKKALQPSEVQSSQLSQLSQSSQLYGCDMCQNCCPFNKNPYPTAVVDEDDILSMDENDFTNRFGHTAMAWRGLEHLRLNAKNIKNTKSTKNAKNQKNNTK